MAVQFDEPVFAPARETPVSKPSKLEQAVISTGLVKSKEGARAILIAISIISLAVALFLFIDSSSIPPPPNPADYEVWPR